MQVKEEKLVGGWGARKSRLVKEDRLPRSICKQENTGIGRVQSVQCESVCRRALCVRLRLCERQKELCKEQQTW